MHTLATLYNNEKTEEKHYYIMDIKLMEEA